MARTTRTGYSAEAGEDRLIGGNGRDTITGGTGDDIVEYNALSELGDTITDFETSAAGDDLD
jgi:Ca2+-binding RTX toxin-like protein